MTLDPSGRTRLILKMPKQKPKKDLLNFGFKKKPPKKLVSKRFFKATIFISWFT